MCCAVPVIGGRGIASEQLKAVALTLAGADEDREDIQTETEKQEDTFDHIGSALGDLKHMSNVSIIYCRPPSLSVLCIIEARCFIRAGNNMLLSKFVRAWTQQEGPWK